MKKTRLILILLLLLCGSAVYAQGGDSFLNVSDFRLLGPENTFVLPEGIKKTDINGKPWTMVEIIAKGFDSNLLNDIKVFSPTSTMAIGYMSYDRTDGSYKIILSSGVKGKLVLTYQGSTLDYQFPSQLVKNRVYQLELEMRSANLTIVATPSDAKIYIDGEEVGSNGYASVNLRLGEHIYSVECENHLNEKNKTVRLEDNERLEVNLKPLFGYISISSEPSGADVYINGTRVGVTPYLNKMINRGKNNVVLKLNGFYDYPELVDVGMGEQKTLEAKLSKYGDVTYNERNTITADLTLYLSRDSLYFAPGLSSDSIFVTTNNIEWSFMNVPQWLSLYKHSNVLFVTCMENTKHEEREADITVFTGDLSKNLHIVQEEGKTVLKSEYNSIVFDADQGKVTRKIQTNVSNWEIFTDCDWISASKQGNILTVVCEENTMPVSRHGKLTIKAYDQEMNFTVAQQSKVTDVHIPVEEVVIGQEGGSMAIPMGRIEGEWTCNSDNFWMKVSRAGDVVVLDCEKNDTIDRRGSFIVNTETKVLKMNVLQKGTVEEEHYMVIDSKPSWNKVYVDGNYVGITPVKMLSDDSLHYVKLGQETKGIVFNDKSGTVYFNHGMSYLQLTLSSRTMGMRSGFIGCKHWGGYNHFQMNIPNWDLKPASDKGPLYIMTFGPSYEIMPWMSAYAGFGFGFSNEIKAEPQGGEKPYYNHSPKNLKYGIEMEAGLLFYYKNIFASGGFQITPKGLGDKKFDFSVGVGAYFNRYYDTKYNVYCANLSRRWWSISYLYNPGRNGHGLMFSDLGKDPFRWYVKGMAEFNNVMVPTADDPEVLEEKKEMAPGLSIGLVFDLMPGSIDIMLGAGYQASVKDSKQFSSKGMQAEAGFVMNIWRFPLTVMMRCCELEKETRYLTVDFGVGFSFGELFNKK